jgi:hypothetical protein
MITGINKITEFKCMNIRKIKNGIIEKCNNCFHPEDSQLNQYIPVAENPIELTVKKWEWLAETGEKYIYKWEHFKEINTFGNYCGFGKVNIETIYCYTRNCPFYNEKKVIGERCFSGKFKEWQEADSSELRKKIALEILEIIKKKYSG